MPNPIIQAKHEVAKAAEDAVKTIAVAAEQAAKVISAAAAKDSTKTDGDHDLLVELKVKMEDLKADIADLTTGTKKEITDHGIRIADLETKISNFDLVKKIVYGFAGLILTTVVLSVIYLVIQK